MNCEDAKSHFQLIRDQTQKNNMSVPRLVDSSMSEETQNVTNNKMKCMKGAHAQSVTHDVALLLDGGILFHDDVLVQLLSCQYTVCVTKMIETLHDCISKKQIYIWCKTFWEQAGVRLHKGFIKHPDI